MRLGEQVASPARFSESRSRSPAGQDGPANALPITRGELLERQLGWQRYQRTEAATSRRLQGPGNGAKRRRLPVGFIGLLGGNAICVVWLIVFDGRPMSL